MRDRSTGALVDGDLPAAGVEADGPDGEDLLVVLGHGDAPAQDGPHAGDELAQPEGLGHVVARSELEPEDDVDLGVAGRHHDDRHRLEGPHLLADLDAGLVGQHDVEQDEVGVDPVEEAQRLVAVAGRLDGEALAGQARGQRLAVRLLVVDDEDERPVVPGRARRAGAGRWSPVRSRWPRCARPQAASWGTRGGVEREKGRRRRRTGGRSHRRRLGTRGGEDPRHGDQRSEEPGAV